MYYSAERFSAASLTDYARFTANQLSHELSTFYPPARSDLAGTFC